VVPSVRLGRSRAIEIGGKRYRLVFGDTHRHTDISRCGMNWDGCLSDAYRYALDAVGLDFLAISDHDQDILRHRYDRRRWPLMNYAWWRSQKYCDLFHIPQGQRFIALYGYEHGGSMVRRGGHKNVLYSERGQPCLEDDAPSALFAALSRLRGVETIAIPHQLADGPSATDWTKWDGRYETVAEIFQTRGSYEYSTAPRLARVKREGHYYWDALAMGVRIGAIASSDHGMTHSAYAGVLVEEFSRRGILRAMKARRTFGATDEILLDFRLGDAPMGAEVTLTEPPRLHAAAFTLKPIRRVDLIRSGQFIYTSQPGGTEYTFAYTDNQFPAGTEGYYYLRVITEGNEIAWSSPIWVKRRE
jgi:hypothetical protein